MELLARRLIRDIPDFPKAGIVFKDITPVVQDAQAFRQVIERMTEYARGRTPDRRTGPLNTTTPPPGFAASSTCGRARWPSSV